VEDSTETQQSGHAPRPEPEVKTEVEPKDGAPERFGCGTIKEEVSQIQLRVSECAAKKNSSVLSCISKRTREGYNRGSEIGTVFVSPPQCGGAVTALLTRGGPK